MNSRDESLFRDWLKELTRRVRASGIDEKLKKELVDRITDPFKDDQIFSKVSAEVRDLRLRHDLVRALTIVDGTFAAEKIDLHGRPLEWNEPI